MRILHTSDWHLGRTLFTRRRHEEHAEFLAWLRQTILDRRIEALLIAGDIFDSAAPGTRAQEMYYRFLGDIRGTCCRHIVLIGGNHDSPTLLEAPRDILRYLDVHVVGCCNGDSQKEIVELKDEQGNQAAIVCAVPYLRDRDVHSFRAGETPESRELAVVQGIRDHYNTVCELAQRRRSGNTPIIAMGHLFTSGGQTTDGDGVRELYVGSLGRVGAEAFPACIDYLALGHLHIAQQVNGCAHQRYSGSPLPMNFGEIGEHKKVICLTLEGDRREVEEIPVNRFQELQQIRGDLSTIEQRLEELKEEKKSIWVEVIYNGNDIVGNLTETFNAMVEDSAVEILSTKDERFTNAAAIRTRPQETLQDLSPEEVFLRRLDADKIESPLRESLIETFGEACFLLQQENPEAE